MEFVEQHNIEALVQLLALGKKRIIITSHTNPDADAVGSSLGLQHVLEAMGHSVSVVLPTEVPSFLHWMPKFERIVIAETHAHRAQEFIKNADIIFSLDYSALSRVHEVGNWIGASKAFKVMIDHHLDPQPFADAHYWRTSASSASELVYELLVQLNYIQYMPLAGLDCLYVGILSDTGGFRYATNARLFASVAAMIASGVDNNKLMDLVFNTYTYKRFKLLTYATSQAADIMEDIGAAIIVLTQKDHEELDIRRGDTEGIPNFMLGIKELKAAILVSERKDEIKFSMRSKGDFSVQSICAEYFNGGGHFNASGGSSKLPLADAVKLLKEILYERLEPKKIN